MKKITNLFTLFLITMSFSISAQCNYTIELTDSFGDGWNGVSTMDVLVNNVVVLDDIFIEAGDFASFSFAINPGDDITTAFNPTAVANFPDYASECSYVIKDALGTIVYTADAGTDPVHNGPADATAGTVTGACPACDVPEVSFGVVSNCPTDDGYSVDVTVTDIGSASSVTISDDQATAAVQVLAANVPTTISFGSYLNATNVVVTVTNDDDGACTISSSSLTFDSVCPPINDECIGAIAVACDATVSGSTVNATDSGGNAAFDVWYKYTGLGNLEDVTLSLCNSGYDTFIRVYDSCGGTQITSNDDSCGTRSEVTFTSDGTSTYYIMIEGFGGAEGTYEMNVTCDTNIPAPSNDNCDNSEPLTIGVTASGTTAGATDQGTGTDDDTTCDPFDFHADVWYSLTITNGPSDITISTTPTGTSTEAGIAVYPAECDFLDASSLACDGSDDPTGGSVDLVGLVNGTYYVRVWSDGAVPPISPTGRVEGSFDILASLTLSTDEFDFNSGLSVYPNPVSNILILNTQKNIEKVTIFNMLGQTVLTATPNALLSELDMSALNSGAYFVKVSVDGATKTVRVIKQ